MASRRKLKKVLKFISCELMAEVYIRSVLSGEVNIPKVDELTMDLVSLQKEFVTRVNSPIGSKNATEVRKYYKELHADWQTRINDIIAQMGQQDN